MNATAVAPDVCLHNKNTQMVASLDFMVDTGRYLLLVRLHCVDCGNKFRFLGLEMGLDVNGARINPDGQEARLAVHPVGEPIVPALGPTGFTIREGGTPGASA